MTSELEKKLTANSIPHEKVMSNLVKEHEIIARLISAKQPVHYIDFPMHGNIGDLLIMQGTLAFFKANTIRPKIVASYFNFNPFWIGEKDVVIFHGGGNFGDLYPGPQQLREHTIVSRPNNRIVVLPQTIHFESEAAYEKCCIKLSKHKDLHIFVRDQRSYELALPMTQHVYLAPDMAHQLWPIRGNKEHSRKGHLGVLRTDDETGRNEHPSGLDRVIDWPELVGKREATTRNIHRALRALHLARLDRHLVSRAFQLWIKRADSLVQEAVDLYSRYENITTDRLHGHILACLMGIPNTLIDNSYRKNSTYANQWTAASDIVQLASERDGSNASE